MKVRLIAVAAVAAAAVFGGLAHASPDPSSRCDGTAPGALPVPGVTVNADQNSGTLRVCNDGSTIPAPAKGAVTAQADTNSQSGSITVDGDGNNTPPDCTQGYVHVSGDSSGPTFYDGSSGNWGDSGNAGGEDAPTFVQNVAANCSGSVPAPPSVP